MINYENILYDPLAIPHAAWITEEELKRQFHVRLCVLITCFVLVIVYGLYCARSLFVPMAMTSATIVYFAILLIISCCSGTPRAGSSILVQVRHHVDQLFTWMLVLVFEFQTIA